MSDVERRVTRQVEAKHRNDERPSSVRERSIAESSTSDAYEFELGGYIKTVVPRILAQVDTARRRLRGRISAEDVKAIRVELQQSAGYLSQTFQNMRAAHLADRPSFSEPKQELMRGMGEVDVMLLDLQRLESLRGDGDINTPLKELFPRDASSDKEGSFEKAGRESLEKKRAQAGMLPAWAKLTAIDQEQTSSFWGGLKKAWRFLRGK